ncbi:MAG TPA: dinitrogenase iron-molybdenum cofactor biosynthesis protein, partial [Candidatus Hydrogenedentes bacterium]|nr:dinitrogenase iron-molybdenum cofactor biosynthesis protein [Candidatus Hydrogenedentota bacterium]
GGPVAGGPAGLCICPQCNEQVAHQRGVPCSAQTCPKCGSALVRAN